MRNIELSFNADAAITKNRIVKMVSPGSASYEPGEGYVEASGAAGTDNEPFGVAHQAASAADAVIPVVVLGEAYVYAGGTFAPGDFVKSNASGQAVKATGSSQHVLGQALEDGSSGKVVKVFVRPGFWTLTS